MGNNDENQQHNITTTVKEEEEEEAPAVYNDENQQHNITIVQEEEQAPAVYKYPRMTKTVGDFTLYVNDGEFTKSEIIVIQGLKGTGKTTLIRMLAGELKPDFVDGKMPQFNVSYMPQNNINPLPPSAIVRDLFHDIVDPHFESHVMQPLLIPHFMDQQVANLSPQQLHRLEICLCLFKPADIYLIDEPSQYLPHFNDFDDVADVIKSFFLHTKKAAVVAESSAYMAFLLHDNRVILCDGKPSICCVATSPHEMFFNLVGILASDLEAIEADPSRNKPDKFGLVITRIPDFVSNLVTESASVLQT
ncbi:ABC transporter E family member 2-like [Lotus japonicus]|uniref:ABC transporter E family member 2-like n=1 Tax=Lotus japonicus TaxID=34305 RepID=UPI0025869435|nr:ABC transporter E family member 2-like [Lotus japonicus]XP_057447576.1 ABC transporter E family member 2-like [Lotus japonicus]XP_057447578.1 ABC transporter E family member 2-like [Lotus japonicus]